MGETSRRMLLVFMGGGTGATLRYLIGLWVPQGWAAPVPLAILLINVAGAAALGAVFVLANEAQLMSTGARLTVTVGFLGGFTTWSTFMTGAVTLFHTGHARAALLYITLSLMGGPLAVFGASTTVRSMVAAGTRRRQPQDALLTEMASIEAEDRDASRTE